MVLCVYESAFDVLIPEHGYEKRVHCDQLPLKKAEFDKHKRVLELYWEKGVPSSVYIPEDERTRGGSTKGARGVAEQAEEARKREHEEAQRRQVETGTISTDDADALFDDDEDGASGITESVAGVSLNASDHAPQASEGASQGATVHANADTPESKLKDKKEYLKLLTLREEGGNHIQDVKEMTRVPVILRTDLTKSPP